MLFVLSPTISYAAFTEGFSMVVGIYGIYKGSRRQSDVFKTLKRGHQQINKRK